MKEYHNRNSTDQFDPNNSQLISRFISKGLEMMQCSFNFNITGFKVIKPELSMQTDSTYCMHARFLNSFLFNMHKSS